MKYIEMSKRIKEWKTAELYIDKIGARVELVPRAPRNIKWTVFLLRLRIQRIR